MPGDETEAIETRLLLEAVYARYGYDFRGYAPDSMRRRTRAALAKSGLPHMGALQHRVLREPAFFLGVLDDLTVQVTEMFRDPAFYRALREHVVPLLRTYPHLKIWHAGCASGEEVYATAIVLAEEGLYDRAQIYGTDISAHALELAREGVYPAGRAAAFADAYARSGGKRRLDDYYTSAYGCIAVREALRKNVVFFQHDLVSDFALGEMQVILCRNVLLYFGPALRGRVLAMFGEGLCRGGFLCLGDSEDLPGPSAARFGDFRPSERVFRRTGAP